jgi:hypothetical protein
VPRDLLQNVYLPDSWVLAVETSDESVCFVLEAALGEGHERYYSPPKAGEQHAYARIRWCLRGEIHWNDGPHLERLATDATGERDYGHIDTWLQSGDRHTLEGDWGCVVIDDPVESIEYLD